MKNFGFILLFVFLCIAMACTPHHYEGGEKHKKEDSKTKLSYIANNDSLEIPEVLLDRPEEILFHEGYSLSYNNEFCLPNWVAWVLTADRVNGDIKRINNFQPDTVIVNGPIAVKEDYSSSTYERGHMCPAGDNKYSYHAMVESFLMSNICPQTHELNDGNWKILEEKCRNWARKYNKLYIVCGPIIDSHKKYNKIGNNKIVVPEQYYKVILKFDQRNNANFIGFILNNDTTAAKLVNYIVSVDSIEKRTGIKFFPKLTSSQKIAKSKVELNDWHGL